MTPTRAVKNQCADLLAQYVKGLYEGHIVYRRYYKNGKSKLRSDRNTGGLCLGNIETCLTSETMQNITIKAHVKVTRKSHHQNTTIQSEMAAHNVLHNVYLKQPAISDWINLLRCGLQHSTLLICACALRSIAAKYAARDSPCYTPNLDGGVYTNRRVTLTLPGPDIRSHNKNGRQKNFRNSDTQTLTSPNTSPHLGGGSTASSTSPAASPADSTSGRPATPTEHVSDAAAPTLETLNDQDTTGFTTVTSKKKNKGTKKQHKNPKFSRKNICTRKTAHKKTSVPFRNVTVIGDSHVRTLSGILRRRTSASNIVVVCKPGAGLLQIKPTTPPPEDHCYVLIAGTNDLAAGRQDIIPTHGGNHPAIFRQLEGTGSRPQEGSDANNYVSELCERYKGAAFLDISDLSRHNFTAYGLHLTTAGKAILADLIVKGLNSPPRTINRTPAESAPRPPLPPPTPPPPPTSAQGHNTYADARPPFQQQNLSMVYIKIILFFFRDPGH
ncbi:hypothetical protein J6590_098091 [Homalodisca vitripennis]|nr:hypothetical protein J6590_098091 [Homalodisca vitripennis]